MSSKNGRFQCMRYAERVCDQCGKKWVTWIDTASWAYKIPDGKRMAIFCGWTCQRAWEKTHITQINSRQIWK